MTEEQTKVLTHNQKFTVMTPEDDLTYSLPIREWDAVKTKIKRIGPEVDNIHSTGMSLIGMAFTALVAAIIEHKANITGIHHAFVLVALWAAMATTMICGAVCVYFGYARRKMSQIYAANIVEEMDSIAQRFKVIDEEQPLPLNPKQLKLLSEKQKSFIDIAFEYLPDDISKHGWKIASDNPDVPLPIFKTPVNTPFGRALAMVGDPGAYIQYDLPENTGTPSFVQVIIRSDRTLTFYARVLYSDEHQNSKKGWIILCPSVEDKPPEEVSRSHWRYFLDPESEEDGFISIYADIHSAVDDTFGKNGAKLVRLLGFRIRGVTTVARISLFY